MLKAIEFRWLIRRWIEKVEKTGKDRRHLFYLWFSNLESRVDSNVWHVLMQRTNEMFEGRCHFSTWSLKLLSGVIPTGNAQGLLFPHWSNSLKLILRMDRDDERPWDTHSETDFLLIISCSSESKQECANIGSMSKLREEKNQISVLKHIFIGKRRKRRRGGEKCSMFSKFIFASHAKWIVQWMFLVCNKRGFLNFRRAPILPRCICKLYWYQRKCFRIFLALIWWSHDRRHSPCDERLLVSKNENRDSVDPTTQLLRLNFSSDQNCWWSPHCSPNSGLSQRFHV